MSQFIAGILIKKDKSKNLFSKPGFSSFPLYYYHVANEIINSINTCEIEGKFPGNESVRSASVPSFPRDLKNKNFCHIFCLLAPCTKVRGRLTRISSLL